MSTDSTTAGSRIWSIAGGVLLVLLGILVLGHTVIATVVSLAFLGWMSFVLGLGTLIACLFRIGRDGFWSGVIGGAMMTVLGLIFLRHPGASAVTLTLVLGTVFLSTGLARIVAAFERPEGRAALLLSGGLSTLLGLSVIFNLFSATFTLLGILLGVQALVEGIALLVSGRSPMLDRAERLAESNP